mmetsp:Transcript_39819/g.68297  ORF Transcript_39819/g.68297 Transcript_39819/m.68297 type:complete len:134 (-) Transcript_39819:283-684(-)
MPSEPIPTTVQEHLWKDRVHKELAAQRRKPPTSQLSSSTAASRPSAHSTLSSLPPSRRADRDARSTLTGTSWQMPSTIRSSEASTVARNKIAELELRLELEKIKRLEREAELESLRSQELAREAASSIAGSTK